MHLIQRQCTLTLSRPTGEGTARPVSRSFQSGWIRRPTEDDSPSPIRWERAGVRVSVRQNSKLFLHESRTPDIARFENVRFFPQADCLML